MSYFFTPQPTIRNHPLGPILLTDRFLAFLNNRNWQWRAHSQLVEFLKYALEVAISVAVCPKKRISLGY